MKVEIKERALKGGNRGLYLEYYEKGFRKRENLHLYLIPDNAPDAKDVNKRTYLKAMADFKTTDHFLVQTSSSSIPRRYPSKSLILPFQIVPQKITVNYLIASAALCPCLIVVIVAKF